MVNFYSTMLHNIPTTHDRQNVNKRARPDSYIVLYLVKTVCIPQDELHPFPRLASFSAFEPRNYFITIENTRVLIRTFLASSYDPKKEQ